MLYICNYFCLCPSLPLDYELLESGDCDLVIFVSLITSTVPRILYLFTKYLMKRTQMCEKRKSLRLRDWLDSEEMKKDSAGSEIDWH